MSPNALLKKHERPGLTVELAPPEEEGTAGRAMPLCCLRDTQGHASLLPQILISADDEMEESDVEEDLRRLTPLKPVKKKKHRFGLPV